MSNPSRDAGWIVPLFLVLLASIGFFLLQITQYTTML
jgi:hypothetical protein